MKGVCRLRLRVRLTQTPQQRERRLLLRGDALRHHRSDALRIRHRVGDHGLERFAESRRIETGGAYAVREFIGRDHNGCAMYTKHTLCLSSK